jgi:cyclic beta-1,2-glucan synthetase
LRKVKLFHDIKHTLIKCRSDDFPIRTPASTCTKVELYVVAADVHVAIGHVGRGGWTWYPGSAGRLVPFGTFATLSVKLSG